MPALAHRPAIQGVPRVTVQRTCARPHADSLEAHALLVNAAARIGGAAAVATYWCAALCCAPPGVPLRVPMRLPACVPGPGVSCRPQQHVPRRATTPDRLPASTPPPVAARVDRDAGGAGVWAALKSELGQVTVPFVFVGGEFLGGCDATKALHAEGALAPRLYAAGAAHGLGAGASESGSGGSSVPSPTTPVEAPKGQLQEPHGHATPYMPDPAVFVDPARPALGDGTPPAPTLFWFPEVVDSHVIRLTAAQVCMCGAGAQGTGPPGPPARLGAACML